MRLQTNCPENRVAASQATSGRDELRCKLLVTNWRGPRHAHGSIKESTKFYKFGRQGNFKLCKINVQQQVAQNDRAKQPASAAQADAPSYATNTSGRPLTRKMRDRERAKNKQTPQDTSLS